MRSIIQNSKFNIHDFLLYGFLDVAYLGYRDPVNVTEQLLVGGVDIFQLRAKNLPPREIAVLARRILPLTRRWRVPLIINDHVDIARAVGADGVHLGQEDAQKIPVAAARDLLGPGKIVGLSTHSVEQALAAQRQAPDYIGFGPIFATPTKPGRPAIGLHAVSALHSSLLALPSSHLSLPFFCIGGINESNLDRVLAEGARRVAIVSAILCASDPAAVARRLKQKLVAAR